MKVLRLPIPPRARGTKYRPPRASNNRAPPQPSPYLAFGPDRNTINARRQFFRCHAIRSFTGWVRMRTALPLISERRDKLDSDFDPTRHRHIAAWRSPIRAI